jgi:thermitase
MSKIRLFKIFSLFLVVALFVSSSSAMFSSASSESEQYNNTQSTDNRVTADYSFRSPSSNMQVSEFDWSPESVATYAEGANSVDVIIGVNDNSVGYSELSNIVRKNCGSVTETISINGSDVMVVNLPVSVVSKVVDQVETSNLSRYVEPNGLCQVNLTPNDAFWRFQWGPKKIGAEVAWNTVTGNKDILVAVIDTGIDYTHPDLIANYVPLGYDFVNMDDDPLDDHGHGTHCAGIIAAKLNNYVGVAGIAQVQIMAEKGLGKTGSGSFINLAKCIIHATNAGAKIISNSWGSDDDSKVISEAIDYATANGVLVFASAGNHESGASFTSTYPACYDSVVAVSSTDSSNKLSSFSNYGSYVDVAAPGSSIYSTMPTYNVTLNNARGLTTYYAYMSGTSMACPHAAGVAALIWSKNPEMPADLVRYQLESSCTDLGSEGFDIYFGHGLINAKAAVEYIFPEDLLISEFNVYKPYIKVDEPVALNATIFNRSLKIQSNLQVQLLVNGSVVNSTVINSISPGAFAYASLSWIPSNIGIYNLTYYLVPGPDESTVENNFASATLVVGASPPEENWTLLYEDLREWDGSDLKAVYSQLYSDVAYFKVEFYSQWNQLSKDINTAILIDTDNDPLTGLSGNYYINQNAGIGTDCMILVGEEGLALVNWNLTLGFFDFDSPIYLAYLDASDYSDEFVVGVWLADLESNPEFDFVVGDAYSDWDWMPDAGYLPFIQDSAEHELTVTLFNATGIEPNGTLVLNAAVFNFGLIDKTNVTLQLLINGAVVENFTVAQLGSGSFYPLIYNWKPVLEGRYNLTVYTQPVKGEVSTTNNFKTITVPVSQKIALISDIGSLDTIRSIIVPMGVTYDSYYNNSYALYTQNLTLLNRYSAVIFYNYDRGITPLEQSTLNSYLAEGGNLIITGIDSLGSPDDLLLADVVRSSSVGDRIGEPNFHVVNSLHPIMNGPYGKFALDYTVSGLYDDNDAAVADTTRNASAIAELADGKAKIIATASLSGKVVYWNGHGLGDWLLDDDCTAMLKNTLIWVLDVVAPETVVEYEDVWHIEDFSIPLAASDYFGVNETYYKLNGGPVQIVSVNGQPQITVQNANNTLEYWSIDLVGNEEPHKFLTEIKLDKTPPTGWLQINNGASYTSSITVELTFEVTDDLSGVDQIRFSNDEDFEDEAWEAVSTSKSWVLTSGDGSKTVYCQIKNNAVLYSTLPATIILDTIPPTANAGSTQTVTVGKSVTLNGGNSADNLGILSYLWDFGDGSKGSGSTVIHTYSTVGTYSAKLTVEDSAGNIATDTVMVVIQAKTSTTPSPTYSPHPTSAPTVSPTASPTATSSPTATPSPNTVDFVKDDGTTAVIAIGGNITTSQITNASIYVDQSTAKTFFNFVITGQTGTVGICNFTIPKHQVPIGTLPEVYLGDQVVASQGYSEDYGNYYVWYIVTFSSHEVSIVFTEHSSTTVSSFWYILIATVAIISVFVVSEVYLIRNRKKSHT